jgi:hypothetical protein
MRIAELAVSLDNSHIALLHYYAVYWMFFLPYIFDV